MKSKHVDRTQGLNCDHQPWPWPWIFKVKCRICDISAKNDRIATKQKANISIELQASNLTNGFDLDHDLDLWILKVKCDHTHDLDHGFSWSNFEIAVSQDDIAQRGWQEVIHDHERDHLVTKVRCMDLPDSDRGDFSCRRAVDSSSFNWNTVDIRKSCKSNG